ncbi:hypothetical protein DL95DRAFT_403958 [Leptodontidium sp. 2 PMI_412]|nr:hypothetical protein DL95DRAFT_403958 [Leptodontidium sp. 2 PMI_412]
MIRSDKRQTHRVGIEPEPDRARVQTDDKCWFSVRSLAGAGRNRASSLCYVSSRARPGQARPGQARPGQDGPGPRTDTFILSLPTSVPQLRQVGRDGTLNTAATVRYGPGNGIQHPHFPLSLSTFVFHSTRKVTADWIVRDLDLDLDAAAAVKPTTGGWTALLELI